MLRAVGVGGVVVYQLSPPRDSPPMFSAVVCHFGKARLETLEERVGTILFGDVLQHVVGDVGQGTVVDLGGGELGADEIGRGGPRHGEHTPLDAGFP